MYINSLIRKAVCGTEKTKKSYYIDEEKHAGSRYGPCLPRDCTVSVPIELAKSMEGKYFVGYAENLFFGEGTGAWARLYNPPDSGVDIYLAVWTVSDISATPFRAQIFFNSEPQDTTRVSPFTAAANTALSPVPQPKAQIQYAVNVFEEPAGGTRVFVRRGTPGITLEVDESGKFIFPPGGSFLVYLTNPENPLEASSGRVGFGWWEEP